MLSLQSLSWHSVKPLSISLRNPSLQKLISTARAYSTSISAANSDSDDFQNPVSGRPNNFSGFKIEETVELDSRKLRLDSWLSSRINGISRARVQSSIRSGLVSVNGHIINKVSHVVRDGDVVNCKIAELQPLRAEPEDIPLDIVYEDEHVLVVNKPAHMVVHPAPGNATGTLVNGILNHCRLSTVFLSPEALPETDDDSGDEASAFSVDQGHTVDIGFGFSEASVRPGIVHRLDKGTSGLLVVAKACAGLLAVKIGEQVHGFSLASGLSLDPFVESSLIHFYVKCDKLIGAHKLFDKMVERDVVSWSALAAGYARKGDVINAKKVFSEVKIFGFEPNTVSWNGMIAGFNQSGCFLDAVLMFQQMHLHGFTSDGTSISSVLPAIGDLGYLNAGTQVHGYVIKIGFAVDKCIVSALIDMYGKCGCALEMSQVFEDIGQADVGACNAMIAGLARHGLVDKALTVFKELQGQGMELNVVSWTSVIACCSQHGKDIEALNIFREMQAAGVKPNSVTIPCLLPACGNIAALMHGKAAHCFSLKRGISGDVYVGSALIDMYANCGKIQAARCCFDRMPARNLVCWNTMLGAYAMHGKAKEAIEIFHCMQRSGQKPDSVSFTSLLSACSQSGLTEEGHSYFESMSKDHGIEARVEHYACIVTLLGRAGKLEEAYSMIKKMPFEPDACVWGALLSSCRLHHNMSLGEVAAGKLFELEPKNPGNYILLSNIYASKGKWKEVDKVRDIMRDMGLRKNPGCSWIEVKTKYTCFWQVISHFLKWLKFWTN
ncbi:hypothetical protein DH2020_039617 [Rehmannia glutinosa]|uniref:RNA-binding S4 domain-containing protein n=1 Tax=Rehmannia glutinosa TaxID=99300 RepID=A0ABR0UXD6_REHGL